MRKPIALRARARKPNFFIVGAPKSGTTAMADYLRGHPDIFLSDPKEPFFWCEDMPSLRRCEHVEDLSSYLALFWGARDQTAIGEGSTLYLYSKVAIDLLHQFQSECRLIVMVRNPLELAPAFHMQMCFHFFEDEPNFEKAWSLQELRAMGRHLPVGCNEPALLQYRRLASLGAQVQRLFQTVPRNQVLLLSFDEFRRNPGGAYRRVLEFLQLPDDGRTVFEKRNEAMMMRNPSVTRVMRLYPVKAASRMLKRSLRPVVAEQLRSMKHSLIRRKQLRPQLSAMILETMRAAFSADIRLLETLTGWDLNDWQKWKARTPCNNDC